MKHIFNTIIVAAMVIWAGIQPAAAQTKRMAVTALSENMMRAEPDYESALETQSLMGTVVEIIGEEGYWRQVVTPEPYTAWCTNLGLVEMTPEQINEYKAAPKYICTAYHSGVYVSPYMKSERMSDLSMGNLLRVVFTEGRKVGPSVVKKEKQKWAEVVLPDGRKGWTPLADLESFEKWAQKPKPSENRIIATAKMFIGTPYLWGGASSKGLDCSGLVRLTWFMNGYLLPRNASQQVHLGREIIVTADHSVTRDSEKFYDEMCRRIENLKPGDLVFFGNPETRWKKESITHVGIYIGNGEIIHASHKVRINSLIPGKSNYYENAHRLLKARRLFDWKGEGLTPISQSKAYNL
jgi:cell wall-associated NlpC family hydrolase